MPENTVSKLKTFFDTPEKKLSTSEFMEFWKSLSESEKEYYKQAELD